MRQQKDNAIEPSRTTNDKKKKKEKKEKKRKFMLSYHTFQKGDGMAQGGH